MAGSQDFKMPDDREAENRNISNKIQDLMPYKFIRISQPVLIDDSVIINDNGIAKRPALR